MRDSAFGDSKKSAFEALSESPSLDFVEKGIISWKQIPEMYTVYMWYITWQNSDVSTEN